MRNRWNSFRFRRGSLVLATIFKCLSSPGRAGDTPGRGQGELKSRSSTANPRGKIAEGAALERANTTVLRLFFGPTRK